MLYYYFKIFHLLSAALLLASMGHSVQLWTRIRRQKHVAIVSDRIQTQTWSVIVPLAIIQLATGFTMLSLKHYDLSQTWVIGSVVGFVLVIGCWFSFLYFLLLSQQAAAPSPRDAQLKFYRHAQTVMLSMCAIALLSMIFFMANPI